MTTEPCNSTAKHNPFWSLPRIFILAVIGRIVLNHAVHGPSIFSDEYLHVEMARALWNHGTLAVDGLETYYPCPLYLMLIAPFFGAFKWSVAYAGARALNAVLMALAVFPAYGLAREAGGDRSKALAAAGLTALLTGAGYAPLIMTENLFLPVMLLAFWMTYRAVLTPTAGRRFAAGLACGLAFHVKPQGTLAPAIAALTVMIFEADRLRDLKDCTAVQKLKAWLRGVGRHWLTAVGWFVAFSPRILAVAFWEHQNWHSLHDILGRYAGEAGGNNAFALGPFLLAFCGFWLVWTWWIGILPMWTFLRQAGASLSGRNDRRTRLLMILIVTASMVMFFLLARHNVVMNGHWKIHERYGCVVTPLAFVLFCIADDPLGPGLARKLRRLLYLLPILIAGFAIWRYPWDLGSSTPSLYGLMLVRFSDRVAHQGIIWVYCALLAIALLFILMDPQTPRRRWMAAALLLAVCNFGWYGAHNQINAEWWKVCKKIEHTIDHNLGPGQQLMVLTDGLSDTIAWQASTAFPGVALCVDKDDVCWRYRLLSIGKDGTVRSDAGSGTTLLLASTLWKFNRKPEADFGFCGLYRMGGAEPLRMDPAQVAARAKLSQNINLKDLRGYFKQLKLKCVSSSLPKNMKLESKTQVQLEVQSEGRFFIPDSGARLSLGWEWRERKNSGDPKKLIRERMPLTDLPADMQPGETHEVTVDVPPPEHRGDWILSVRPILISSDNYTYWGSSELVHGGVKIR